MIKSTKSLSNAQRSIFRQEVVEDLQNAQKQLKHTIDTIYRLQNEKQAFSVGSLIERARSKQNEIKITITKLEFKIQSIDDGIHDQEFLQIMQANRAEAEKKKQIKLAKKKKQTPPATREVYQTPYKKNYTNSARDNNYELDRYFHNWIPDKLQRDLEHMENNRGFLWRGSAYYGKLPCTTSPDICILSERVNLDNNRFEIRKHEYSPTTYRVYTEWRGRRTILTEEPRIRIPNGL